MCGLRVSLLLGLYPLLVASFGSSSFRNLKIWKMWSDSYFACVFQVAFRCILFRTSLRMFVHGASIKNNSDF